VNGLTLVPNSDPSSLTLASASDDGSVHVWRAVVGDELLLTQGIGISDKKIYNGHRGQKVNAVTALFDLPHIPQYSGLLASAGDDETVQIWSAYQYYQPVFIYTGHRAPVKTLAFSPSSADSRLVSGDADGQVHLWTLELP
jgi:WD40 repeat protein